MLNFTDLIVLIEPLTKHNVMSMFLRSITLQPSLMTNSFSKPAVLLLSSLCYISIFDTLDQRFIGQSTVSDAIVTLIDIIT